MKRKGITTALAVLCMVSIFALFGALTAAEMPESMMLGGETADSNRKGPVPFEHQVHAEDYAVECAQCHHVYKDGKNVWQEGDPVQKCVECHDPAETKGNVKRLRTAFHKNCKDCHRKLVKEGTTDSAPYKRCNDCHRKKS